MVHGEARSRRVHGVADLAFDAAPGSLAEVWYAPPLAWLLS